MASSNFTVMHMPQRSDEWRLARAGRLTGSRAGDMLATIQKGEAAARRDLRIQLVVERLTGIPQDDSYINAAMQRGIDMEPSALLAYEALTGRIAQTTGFLAHPTLLAGCSVDAHVGDFEGLVTVKCPKSATHLRYLRSGCMPTEYVPQMLHELWIADTAQFYDFLSFDDRFPEPMQVFHVRVKRADVDIAGYEKAALKFLKECDRELAGLKGWSVLQTA